MIRLSEAVAQFQEAAGENYWSEHGISDAECLKGLVATFTAAGIRFEDDLSAEWARQSEEQQKAFEEREATRRAAMTPEQRTSEDRLRKMMAASSTATKELLYHQMLTTTFDATPRMVAFKSEGGPGLLQRITLDERVDLDVSDDRDLNRTPDEPRES